MNKADWAAALRIFTQSQRQQNPIPDRDTITEEEEWQCRLIGGEFVSWSQRWINSILKQRMVLQRMVGFDLQPLIVFTTSMPGLVAAQEIVPKPPPNLFYLLDMEFAEWEKQNLVDSFTFHIQHHSFFRPVDEEILAKAKTAFPKVNTSELRVHTTGDLWGERCGTSADHLLRWDGQELELLEEAFLQRVY